MAVKYSYDNTGIWVADLNVKPCTRYDNAELTLTSRVHLVPRNPAGGAAEGTAKDWGTDATGTGPGHGTAHKIVRWTGASWAQWTRHYKREAEKAWNGQFWLIARNEFAELDYEDRKVKYRPNFWCLFKLELVDSAAKAHVSIDVVKLHPSATYFRPDGLHLSNRDLEPNKFVRRSGNYKQKLVAHETGHLIGLGHASENDAVCRASGSDGHESCYCATASHCGNVMGLGDAIREDNGQPWADAIYQMAGGGIWDIRLVKHFPRTMEEVKAKRQITVRPMRG